MFGREREGTFECVLPEESRYFGGFFEEKIENFYSKNPPYAWTDFRGIEGVIKTPFCEEIPPERDELGAAFEGMDG